MSNARLLVSFVVSTVAAPGLLAQTTAPATGSESGEVLILDPFTVSEGSDEGYAAKSSASGLGFVVETARLPIALTTVTPALLADLGVVKVEDALRYVSGVANEGRTSKTETYILRGFAVDGSYRNGEIFGVPTDSAVIDRIEVVKGPSTIIYGVSDPAGVVNTVTKKPSFTKAVGFRALWDEYGSARAIFDYNTPIEVGGDWRAAARIIAAHGREGFPRPNEFRDRTIVAPSLHLEYGRNTILDVSYHRTEEDGRVNRIQIPWDRGNPPFDPTVFGIGLVPVRRDFTFVTPNDDWDFRSEGLDVKLVQRLSDNLTLQLSFVRSQIDRDHYFNLGTGRTAPNAQGQYFAGNFLMVVEPATVDHRGLSGRLLYDFETAGLRHKLTVGVRENRDTAYEFAYYDNSVRADPTLQIIADANGGVPVRFQGAPRTAFSPTGPNVLSLSGTTALTNPNPVKVRTAFVSDYITAMDDRLNVLVGLSYIDIFTQKEETFVPQFGFVYDLGRGIGLYGLYSKSAKANGPASTLNPALGFLSPEKGVGTEIGFKFNPAQGKVSGTLAFFEIKRENIVQFLGGGIFDQNNNIPSGEETSEGVELDLVYSPAPGLSLTFAYAYTDAYISKQELSVTADFDGDGISDAVGLPKEGVAKHDIRLWSSYAFPEGSSLHGLRLGGGFTWRQGPIQQFAGYIQRFIREEGDPTRLDLFAAYDHRLMGVDTRYQLNWYNATDEDFLDRRGYRVQPSTLTLSVDFSW